MDVIKPPEPLKLTGNIDYAWKLFKQAFQLYLTATGANDKSGERKVALLLTIAGTQAIAIFNTFKFTDGDEKKLSNVLEEAEWPSGRSGDFPVGRPANEVRWTGPQLCSGLRSQLDRPTVVSGREASASRP